MIVLRLSLLYYHVLHSYMAAALHSDSLVFNHAKPHPADAIKDR